MEQQQGGDQVPQQPWQYQSFVGIVRFLNDPDAMVQPDERLMINSQINRIQIKKCEFCGGRGHVWQYCTTRIEGDEYFKSQGAQAKNFWGNAKSKIFGNMIKKRAMLKEISEANYYAGINNG